MQGDRDQMAATVAYTKAQTAAVIPLVAGINQRIAMAPTQVAHGSVLLAAGEHEGKEVFPEITLEPCIIYTAG